MAEASDQSTEPFFGEQLQQITESLAAALTETQVFGLVLQPAIEALCGLSGLIMLVDGDQVRVVARRGDDPDLLPVWQDRPLEAHAPATDALRRRQPLYFERGGELTAAYPQLEAQTGGTAAVASAAVPIVLDGRGLGVLVLDFREPHAFSPEERSFLQTLAGQCAIALDRIRAFEQERSARRALEASEGRFRMMVMASPTPVAVGALDGSLVMANDAYLRLLGFSRAEFEAGQINWLSLNRPEDREQDQAMFAVTFEQGASPVYQKVMFTKTGEARVLRVQLLRFEEGERSLVIGYLEDLTEHMQREQGLRSRNETLEADALSRAADLSEQRAARQSLQWQNDLLEERVQGRTTELEARTAALDAFLAFTEAVGSETEVRALAQQATRVIQANLAHASTAYYEPDGDLWRSRLWSGDLSPEVAAQIEAGVPQDAPNFAAARRSEEPYFVDGFDAAENGVESARSYGAVAFVPLVEGGQVSGLFTVGVQETRAWRERERALVRAVGRGFTLALERSEGARQLARQNAELAARNQALEAFADLSRDLMVETDRYKLVRRAQEIVLALVPRGYAVYYEPEGPLWRLRSQVGQLGDDALQAMVDAGLPHDAPSLHTPFSTCQPFYQDVYAQGTDTPAEVVRHILAVATLPLLMHGVPIGVFGVGLFEQRTWTNIDRVVMETVLHNLGLAVERAESMAQLAERTAQLERSNAALQAANEELEAFTYSVSHDLMTPVRHVTSFAQLAGQNLDDQAKTQRYLGIIGQGAQRMNTLIEAMLQLSRTGRRELRLGMVDLGALVTQARADLAAELEGRHIEWRVEPLPLVTGDREMLQQVMTNLLDNAVKYTRPREQAEVRVWAEEGEEGWSVSVQDNGVGFDPRYVDKLFGIFQRLHRQEEFEGVGVGLAGVRRILTRHGGAVRAEGVPGEGATFSFTLPKQG